MEMEIIESSLIYARGHDAETHLMNIQFKDPKTGSPTSTYQYGNVSPELYLAGCTHISDRTGEPSFGQWFQKIIKPQPKQYPYRKIEDARDEVLDDAKAVAQTYIDATTDFASGQPLPATTAEPTETIPDDPEQLKTAAMELKTKASAIVINSPEACELAMRTGMAIARMRDALEKTFRPEIKKKHELWKSELAVLNYYDQPLESDQNRLREGIVKFRNEQKRIADEEARRLREIEQRKADEEARIRAEELKLSDAVEAEQRGEVDLAEAIIAAPALPLAAAIAAPVYVPVNVPQVKGSTVKEKWVYEITDINLIPREYFLLDTKALNTIVGRLKQRTNIPGIRAYDEGSVSFSKK